jgi:hypothetical protein
MSINEDILKGLLPPGMSIKDFMVEPDPDFDFKEFKVRSLVRIVDRGAVFVERGDIVSLTCLPGKDWQLDFMGRVIETDPIEGIHFNYIAGTEQPPEHLKPERV